MTITAYSFPRNPGVFTLVGKDDNGDEYFALQDRGMTREDAIAALEQKRSTGCTIDKELERERLGI